MKLPKKIIVFGQVVKVEYADLDDNIGGLCHPNGLIQISNSIEKKHVPQILLHEVIHAAFGRISLYQVIIPSVEEIVAEAISKTIIENFEIKAKKL